MAEDNDIAKRLAVLGHPVRFAVIRLLVPAGPQGLAAGYMSTQLETAPNALTFHLQKLEHVGLITSRREGQFILYSAAFDELSDLADSLVGACCADSITKCGPGCPTGKTTPANAVSNPPVRRRRAG